MLRFIIICTSALVLSGCLKPEPVWYGHKPKTTFSQKTKDYLACEVLGAKEVPVATVVGTTPSYTTPKYDNPVYCNTSGNLYSNSYSSSTTCTGGGTSGGQTYGGQTYSYDANAQLRKDFIGNCVESKGYKRTDMFYCKSKDVPKDFKVDLNSFIPKPTEGSCIAVVNNQIGVPYLPSK
jgi:hypothetical protein